MQENVASSVYEYIEIINNLHKTQKNIASDQINNIIKMKEVYEKSNASSYYKYLLKERRKALNTISSNTLYFEENNLYKFYYRGHYNSSYKLNSGTKSISSILASQYE